MRKSLIFQKPRKATKPPTYYTGSIREMLNVRANTKTSARNKINKRKYVIKYASQNN